jgi:hypothetical protein
LIRVSLEPGSNDNTESEEQLWKQLKGMNSTSAGMQIDGSDEQFSNAFFPISVSLEPDSNVN